MKYGKRISLSALLILILVGSVVVHPIVLAQPVQGSDGNASATITVNDDGDADYQSIQTAIDSASFGDTIEVKPGTYEEKLHINKTVDIVAPRGAILDGSKFKQREDNGITIEADSDATPLVKGFTIRNYWKGVHTDRTEGAWVLEDVTIVDNKEEGIDSENTTGDWRIRDSVIKHNGGDGLDVDGKHITADWTITGTVIARNGDQGIDSDQTSNDPTIRDSVVRGNANGGILGQATTGDWVISDSVVFNNTWGVLFRHATGNWTIELTTFQRHPLGALHASNTSGDWTIRRSVFRNNLLGVNAPRSSGDWTILDSRFEDMNETENSNLQTQSAESTAIYVFHTTGNWEIHRTSFVGHRQVAINATDGAVRGNATQNWFGEQGEPGADDCIGSVDCGDALSEPHTVESAPTVDPSLKRSSQNRGSGELLSKQSVTLLAFGVGVVVVAAVMVVLNRRIKR